MFKFIHAADVHLDSPLRGLERYEGAPVDRLRGATREALENLVDLAIDEQVDFLVIAGDLWDGDWRDYGTNLFFAKQMQRLNRPVYLIRGNHDFAKQVRLPSNVYELSSAEPETMRLEDLGVAIHGQSFPTRHVPDNLARNYPEPIAGYFNVGLLHTSLDGREGHDTYAPCHVEDLLAKGYDYWALGHIHQREVIHEDPWIVYPGNLQGRHIRETGPKGCSVVEVKEGRVKAVKHHSLDVLRWQLVQIDIAQPIQEQLHQALERDLFLALRIELTGKGPLHLELVRYPEKWVDELRHLCLEIAGDRVWLERVRFCSEPEEQVPVEGPVGEIAELVMQLQESEQGTADLFESLQRLNTRTRQAFGEEAELLDEASQKEILDEAQDLLLARLLEQ